MLNVWVAEKGLHCSLNIGMYKENGKSEAPAWRILLADTIRHIANTLEERYGQEPAISVAQILEMIHIELNHHTSETKSDFHNRHN